jgi:hypothetical protein
VDGLEGNPAFLSAAQYHDGSFWRLIADAQDHRQALCVRKAEIQQHGVEGLFGQQGQAFGKPSHRLDSHLVSARPLAFMEHDLNQTGVAWVVFDEQDAKVRQGEA